MPNKMISMRTINRYLELIAAEPSRKMQDGLFNTACAVYPHLVEIFNAAYSPNITYGIRKLEDSYDTGVMKIEDEKTWEALATGLAILASRGLTGNAAKEHVASMFEMLQKDSQDILRGILERDLHCNYTAGYVKNKFQVVLANKFDPTKHTIGGTTHAASRKLDGVRCVAIITPTSVKYYSRSGKEFHTLQVLDAELQQRFPLGAILDGEICIVDEDGSENFQETNSYIKRKNFTIQNPKYYVFDVLHEKEFYGKITSAPLYQRLARWDAAQPFIVNQRVHLLEMYQAYPSALAALAAQVKEKGWEGYMLREVGPYKAGRGKHLLKVKMFHDAEYKVLSVSVGEMDHNGARYTNVLLSVNIKHKGSIVSVGSGFSWKQRLGWGSDPKYLIGKEITVKYFEETTNKKGGNSLRFPVFKGFHGKKRTV